MSPLATSGVPTSFKKSVIIPVPKNSKPSCLNDYRPVALTSIVMKVFERLLKNHICSSIPATLDPLQFGSKFGSSKLQGLRCEWGPGVLNLMLSLSPSHTGHWKFNMAPHGKELSEDLKKKYFCST